MIYWAAPFFDRPWIDFNASRAQRLRDDGWSVFLPQEQGFNRRGHDPTAEDVFNGDLGPLQRAQLVVAAIDGEAIDAGVAAEAGLAYAYGIPVLGLYTDFRRHRAGEGRQYRNLFLLGLLGRSAGIVDDDRDLVAVVRERLGRAS